MAPRRYLILTALAASLLAPGCCCPQLSGRYCNPCCCQSRADLCCCPLCVATRCQMTACCPSPACLPPECQPQTCPPAEDPCPIAADSSQLASCPNSADCPDPCGKSSHCGWLRTWFARQRNGVPSQQHPDYYSPPAKFHPIPTRPAFEPLPSYPPLLPADPGLNNPLRASTDRSDRPSVR
ncbi:MAG TPA: hypothetical protein VGI40_06860 [Pirellulaceae bacterium]